MKTRDGEVMFDSSKESWFLGRNGTFKQRGLRVNKFSGLIYFHPVTSKGLDGRSTITIPEEYLPELISMLNDEFTKK